VAVEVRGDARHAADTEGRDARVPDSGEVVPDAHLPAIHGGDGGGPLGGGGGVDNDIDVGGGGDSHVVHASKPDAHAALGCELKEVVDVVGGGTVAGGVIGGLVEPRPESD